jgi:hypothetical protein
MLKVEPAGSAVHRDSNRRKRMIALKSPARHLSVMAIFRQSANASLIKAQLLYMLRVGMY